MAQPADRSAGGRTERRAGAPTKVLHPVRPRSPGGAAAVADSRGMDTLTPRPDLIPVDDEDDELPEFWD
ncbi:hypothetical protein N866_18760 [Actinotalea ferrariae CF5-4]|uniref:Uncharacterized protein n=1 Tax=Actinotalea ferrariae CF5-4 TaxID=948458 RepID=A0A021VUH9_9CELL|nr:hypothetical protein N866_18760 [Actinotalea ferrariae CF5-4]